MFNKIKGLFKSNSYKNRIKDIDPDEIFLDSENLPKFDVNQFEGRLEKPISIGTFVFFGITCFLILGGFFFRAFDLQVINGQGYSDKSENNRLKNTLLFSSRGVVYDRNDNKLAWNVVSDNNPEFSLRKYSTDPGLSHVVGYVKYPSKDTSGFYYSEDFIGKDGVEKYYNDTLTGQNGSRIIEVDAKGAIQSESVVRPPVDGKDLKLSIDSGLQSYMYTTIANLAHSAGFTGGAGIMMDINTGEVIAMTSFPEFNSQ